MWILAGFIILLWLMYKYFTRNFDYWEKRNVPYIKPRPFVGNFGSVLTLQESIFEWANKYYKQMQGDYFGAFIADQPHLVIRNPKIVKNVLTKEFSCFENRENTSSKGIMKYFLFFAKNPIWKMTRVKMSAVFTPSKLKQMTAAINSESRKLVKHLQTTNGETVEVKVIGNKYSINNIVKCAFGLDAQGFEKNESHFLQIARQSFDNKSFSNSARQTVVFFLPDLVKLFNISFFNPKIINETHEIVSTVLQERQKNSYGKTNDMIDSFIEIKRKDLKNQLPEEAFVATPLNFFFAGFETVSSTFSFLFYELALQEKIQERLRMEVTETLQRCDGNINYESISQMQYLHMVLHETLRKYPSLPFLDRRCNASYKIPGSDLVLEKGIPVLIPVMAMHYDEQYFPNPEKFDPERFADMSQINQDGFYYIPFGEGPRICIGARFALLALKIAAVHVLKEYKIEKVETTPDPMVFDEKGITLGSKFGIPLKFRKI